MSDITPTTKTEGTEDQGERESDIEAAPA